MNLGFAKRFLSLVTPIVTIVTGTAIAPLSSLAATLASSEAGVNIGDFNRVPLEVTALARGNVYTLTTDGQVTAEAIPAAAFINNPSEPPYAYNYSLSTVSGEGKNFFGLAQSSAEVIGYNFLVGSNEVFSFDFSSFLNLQAVTNNPLHESASADGTVSLQLIDSSDGSLLDYFVLSGSLATSGQSDSLGYDKSASIALNLSKLVFDTSVAEAKTAEVAMQGVFARRFPNQIYITLIESKTNTASSKTIPEPSNKLALLLFCLIGVGYRVTIAYSDSKSPL